MTRPRLTIDWTRCDGHGLCSRLLPELIELDEWGYPIIRDTVVPDDLTRPSRLATQLCPALALRIALTVAAHRESHANQRAR